MLLIKEILYSVEADAASNSSRLTATSVTSSTDSTSILIPVEFQSREMLYQSSANFLTIVWADDDSQTVYSFDVDLVHFNLTSFFPHENLVDFGTNIRFQSLSFSAVIISAYRPDNLTMNSCLFDASLNYCEPLGLAEIGDNSAEVDGFLFLSSNNSIYITHQSSLPVQSPLRTLPSDATFFEIPGSAKNFMFASASDVGMIGMDSNNTLSSLLWMASNSELSTVGSSSKKILGIGTDPVGNFYLCALTSNVGSLIGIDASGQRLKWALSDSAKSCNNGSFIIDHHIANTIADHIVILDLWSVKSLPIIIPLGYTPSSSPLYYTNGKGNVTFVFDKAHIYSASLEESLPPTPRSDQSMTGNAIAYGLIYFLSAALGLACLCIIFFCLRKSRNKKRLNALSSQETLNDPPAVNERQFINKADILSSRLVDIDDSEPGKSQSLAPAILPISHILGWPISIPAHLKFPEIKSVKSMKSVTAPSMKSAKSHFSVSPFIDNTESSLSDSMGNSFVSAKGYLGSVEAESSGSFNSAASQRTITRSDVLYFEREDFANNLSTMEEDASVSHTIPFSLHVDGTKESDSSSEGFASAQE